jgi:integrase
VLRRKKEPLGFVDQITKRQAMQLRAQLLEIVNQGRVLVQSEIRFRDLVKRFEAERIPQLGAATQAKYETQIRRHILPAFGELRMYEVDVVAIKAWLAAKKEAGLGWWSCIDLKGILSALFTAAKEFRMWDGDNPVEGLKLPYRKKLVREKRLLTSDQVCAILAAVQPRERFMVQIMFGLGLRVSEVLGLRWSDVDLDAETVSVEQRWYRGDIGETKSEAGERVLQLGSVLAYEFKRHRPKDPRDSFVFIGDDGHMPPDDRDVLRECFRPVLKRLGLYYKGFGWHAFRRQNITWRQTIGGATPLEAQRAAGQASLDMTYLYTLPDAERERQQINAMFAELMGPAQGGKQ